MTVALSPRRRVVAVVTVAVAAVVAVWYFWPGLRGEGGVAAIGDASSRPILDDLAVPIRERGRSFRALDQVASWCALADQLDGGGLPGAVQRDASFLVLAIQERGTCADDPVARVVAQLRRRSLEPVIVVFPGQSAPGDAVRLALTEPLLGGPEITRMPCEWWDSCDTSGSVAVRSGDGQLTDVGIERVARVVAATIG